MEKRWRLYCLTAKYRTTKLISMLSYIASTIISCVMLKWSATKGVFKILSFTDILKNNVQVILIILSGAFTLGVTSLLNIISNDFLLGGNIRIAIENGACLTLALISIILLVMAAFVEVYISPRIAEYSLSRWILD